MRQVSCQVRTPEENFNKGLIRVKIGVRLMADESSGGYMDGVNQRDENYLSFSKVSSSKQKYHSDNFKIYNCSIIDPTFKL